MCVCVCVCVLFVDENIQLIPELKRQISSEADGNTQRTFITVAGFGNSSL